MAPNSSGILNFTFVVFPSYPPSESGTPPAFLIRVGSWKVKHESGRHVVVNNSIFASDTKEIL